MRNVNHTSRLALAEVAGVSERLECDGVRASRGQAVPAAPTVSVIVLVLEDTGNLLKCLDSIQAAPPAEVAFEVVVVANGTSNNALRPLLKREDIVLIRSSVNLGFGGGCNWASRFARGEYLLLLNDDATVEPGWMDSLLATLAEHPEAGMAGSRVVYSDGTLQEAGSLMWSDGASQFVGHHMPRDGEAYQWVRPVDYASGCSLLIRRSVWDELGGLDPVFFPGYYEDVDFCFRARTSGHKILYDPFSVICHAEGASTGSRWRNFIAAKNGATFLARWNGSSLLRPGNRPSDTPDAVERSLIPREIRRVEPRSAVLVIEAELPDCESGDTQSAEVDLLERLAQRMWVTVCHSSRQTRPAARVRLQRAGIEVLSIPADEVLSDRQGIYNGIVVRTYAELQPQNSQPVTLQLPNDDPISKPPAGPTVLVVLGAHPTGSHLAWKLAAGPAAKWLHDTVEVSDLALRRGIGIVDAGTVVPHALLLEAAHRSIPIVGCGALPAAASHCRLAAGVTTPDELDAWLKRLWADDVAWRDLLQQTTRLGEASNVEHLLTLIDDSMVTASTPIDRGHTSVS